MELELSLIWTQSPAFRSLAPSWAALSGSVEKDALSPDVPTSTHSAYYGLVRFPLSTEKGEEGERGVWNQEDRREKCT